MADFQLSLLKWRAASPSQSALFFSCCCLFFKLFIFILEYSWLTTFVSKLPGRQQRNPAMHIQVSILPQTPLPSRLPHNVWAEFLVLYTRSLLAIGFKGVTFHIPSPTFVLLESRRVQLITRGFWKRAESELDITFHQGVLNHQLRHYLLKGSLTTLHQH